MVDCQSVLIVMCYKYVGNDFVLKIDVIYIQFIQSKYLKTSRPVIILKLSSYTT